MAHGGELFDRIFKNSAMSEKSAKHVMRQILSALSYMHRYGVVWRDAKAENVVFMQKNDLHVKLIDFGCVCVGMCGCMMHEVCCGAARCVICTRALACMCVCA